MKATERFQATIKEYLDKKAESDELFAKNYKKENKTLAQCINYIFNTVRESGMSGFADEEIYSMAIHYYDEDDITAESELKDMNVIVNHQVQLTDEEKQQARDEARKRAETDAYNEMRKKKTRKSDSGGAVQKSLF